MHGGRVFYHSLHLILFNSFSVLSSLPFYYNMACMVILRFTCFYCCCCVFGDDNAGHININKKVMMSLYDGDGGAVALVVYIATGGVFVR